MRVFDERKIEKVVFSQLKIGDVFSYRAEFYMKLGNDQDDIDAWNLSANYGTILDACTSVVRCEAVLHIIDE